MPNPTADFRSDTVTRPTPAMYDAIANAALGDDVLGDDPTVEALEAYAAETFGKPAAMFTPSGTMANQAALMAWLRPGDEILCEAKCHVFNYEGGGAARLSGAQPRPIAGPRGQMPLEALAEALAGVRPANEHLPRTRMIALENTHNLHGGAILPLDYIRAVRALADREELIVHLDGARLANAVAATGIAFREWVAPVHSVSICLSKGLCAPVGSLLLGDDAFIAEARRARKVLGGGMRQAGLLAAAGRIALESMVDRLVDDHRRARDLATGMATLGYLDVDPEAVETNILSVGVSGVDGGAPALVAALAERDIRCIAFGPERMRLVTHRDVDDDDVARAIDAFVALAP